MVLQCLEVHLEVPSLLTFLPALMTAVCQISNTCTHIHIFSGSTIVHLEDLEKELADAHQQLKAVKAVVTQPSQVQGGRYMEP